MLLSEIKNVVRQVARNGCKMNLCLKGHQGIGKTQILQQVADELGWDYKAIYCAQTSTEDLMGMPKIVEDGKGGFVTEFAKPTLFPDKEGTIFVLEEINRAPLEVQQSILQLLTDKKLGNFVLPKNTLICACINPTNSVYMTQELDSVFVNRMVTINVETSTEEFCKYARTKNIDEDIISFISSLNSEQIPVHFTQVPDENTIGKAMPSPRTWMIANSILHMNLNDTLLAQMLSGAIGKETTTFFLTTRNQLNKILTVDEVIYDFAKAEPKLQKQNDGTMLKFVNDFVDILNYKKGYDYTSEQIANMGKLLEYICDNYKALASMLYQKLIAIDTDSLFHIINKHYISKDGVKIATLLVTVGKSIK